MSESRWSVDDLIPLFKELRGAGFAIGIAEQLAALEAAEASKAVGGDQDLRRLRNYLGPVLCNGEEEQEEFRRRFDRWWSHGRSTSLEQDIEDRASDEIEKRETLPPIAERPGVREAARVRPGKWLVAALVLFLLVVVGLWEMRSRSSETSGPTNIAVTPTEDGADPTEDGKDPAEGGNVPAEDGNVPSEDGDVPSGNGNVPAEDDQAPDDQVPAELSKTLSFKEFVATPGFRSSLAILPLLLALAWWGWRREQQVVLQRLRRPDVGTTGIALPEPEHDLYRGAKFARVRAAVRKRLISGRGELDGDATVEQTIDALGFFTPVYRNRLELPVYLALIDRESLRDQQARQIEELLDRLQDGGVAVERYWFRRDPRRLRGEAGEVRTLAEVAGRRSGRRLLLFGDFASGFGSASGGPARWLEEFTAWRDRAVLTPAPACHWGKHEEELTKQGFVVVPAGVDGLAMFVAALGGENYRTESSWQAPMPALLSERPGRWLETHPADADEIADLDADLFDYLGRDGFRWLRSLAVYPGLDWSLTLYLGLLLRRPGDEPVLKEETLARLVRLPWLRHGVMPDWLRLHWIREMSSGDEIAVRGFLRDLLELRFEPDIERWSRFRLDVARPEEPGEARRWSRLLRGFLRAEPDRRLRDQVFVSFLFGEQERLQLHAPSNWRRWVFEHGMSSLGLRPWIVATAALVLTLVIIRIGSDQASPDQASPDQAVPEWWKIVEPLEGREDSLEFLKQRVYEIGSTKESAEAVLVIVEEMLPWLQEDPTDFQRLASVIWTIDFGPGRIREFSDQASQMRERVLAPLLAVRPRPADDRAIWATIPGGEFLMGSEDGNSDEQPVHEVNISSFELMRHEVTNEQYRRLVPGHASKEEARLPAANVSWYDAVVYSAWIGGRLPTEAEWEYAARAGCVHDYCDRYGGETSLDAVAWTSENSNGRPYPIMTRELNPFELYDMLGNVWEWTGDWYGDYSSESATDPWGPPSSVGRVFRGGGFRNQPVIVRPAYRSRFAPGFPDGVLGFRVARPLPAPPSD